MKAESKFDEAISTHKPRNRSLSCEIAKTKHKSIKGSSKNIELTGLDLNSVDLNKTEGNNKKPQVKMLRKCSSQRFKKEKDFSIDKIIPNVFYVLSTKPSRNSVAKKRNVYGSDDNLNKSFLKPQLVTGQDSFAIGGFNYHKPNATHRNKSISSTFYSESLKKNVAVLFCFDFKNKGSTNTLFNHSSEIIPEVDSSSFQSFSNNNSPSKSATMKNEKISISLIRANESNLFNNKSKSKRISLSKTERDVINFSIKKVLKHNHNPSASKRMSGTTPMNYSTVAQTLYDEFYESLKTKIIGYDSIAPAFCECILEMMRNQLMKELLNTENMNNQKSSFAVTLIVEKEIWCVLMNKMKLLVNIQGNSRLFEFYANPLKNTSNDSFKVNNFMKKEIQEKRLDFVNIKSESVFNYVTLFNSIIMSSINDQGLQSIVNESLKPEMHQMRMCGRKSVEILKVLTNFLSILEKSMSTKEFVGCSIFFRDASNQTINAPSFKFRFDRDVKRTKSDCDKKGSLTVVKHSFNYQDIDKFKSHNLFESPKSTSTNFLRAAKKFCKILCCCFASNKVKSSQSSFTVNDPNLLRSYYD